MKINMPVTANEVQFSESEFMLTKTDMKGVITFANKDFIKISGYSEEELVGSSHNIVRHPDMPVEAFEDLWRDLKAGKPWTGLVKNRTKNGDYYWVEANAAPVFENGHVTGYLSARKKPSREQVDAADAAYRLFKEGKAHGLRILHGKVVHDHLLTKMTTKLHNLNISQRLFGLSGIAVTIATVLVLFGLNNLSNVNASFKTVYEDRMVPIGDLDKIVNLLDQNLLMIRTALSDVAPVVTKEKTALVIDASSLANAITTIEKNQVEIDKLWKGYMATYLTPEEKVLAEKYNQSRNDFDKTIIQPALTGLKANDWSRVMKAIAADDSAIATVLTDAEALHKLQFDVAMEEYNASVQRLSTARYVSFASLIAAIGLLIWLSLVVRRSIVKPLENAIQVFNDISSGNYRTSIDAVGENEMSAVLNSLKITQTGLNVNTNAQLAFSEKVKEEALKYEGQLAAIANSTEVLEFNMAGRVIGANQILLRLFGYNQNEVLGLSFSDFLEEAYRNNSESKQLWEKLVRGEVVSGEFKRITKYGSEVWILGSYNPIFGIDGKPYKVVLYANDITEQKLRNADFEGQMSAIGKSQGVIELGLDGKVIKANATYLAMLGYSAMDLVGKHVSMVLDPTFANSAAYKDLWNKLVAGGSDAGQYKRISKTGKEVWIQASYNPIYDLNGKVYKIVNYTIDITSEKLKAADNAGQLTAISVIQGVVEFDLTGIVMSVNDNFAHLTGYAPTEIVGSHHSIFVDTAYKSSQEYKAFWDALTEGIPQIGQYKRIGKGGKEIWLQASYNPILDMNGKPFKVVKFATDITEQHKTAAIMAEAVEETQHVIEGAKTGDLTSRVPLDGKTGAIASLCDGVNALMDKMTEVIVQVREAGETINTAAGEISSGNNDLSSRTEQQASSLEETAASMEELASTVKNNAENAKQANQLAASASTVAVKGGEVVGQVVSTMSAINESAKKIEDIISVIDGIAFQTNILALNAAVEAARAGEQGRGFAVVAGEVRNLAQRSSSAAKEIKELITDSVSKTAEGTTQVEQAGKTMQEIVSSVQRVTDIMGEITAASVEQSAGIDQVNQAVTSMDEVTQQNAALVEEAAAAAESLVEQAVSLMDTVNEFKLKGENQVNNNRRANNSPMRKPFGKKVVLRSVATKTGTDNIDDWEVF